MPAQSILLTRPAAASTRFAAALHAALGDRVRTVISPLMVPEYLWPSVPSAPFAALILTSETGAEAARRISAKGCELPRRAYCVGDQTARVAKAAGFDAVSARGDAAALLDLIQAAPPTGPLLYLHGQDTRGEVAQTLETAGISVVSRAVYAQTARPLTSEASALLAANDPVLLPVFSPRSAALILSAGRGTAPLWIAALSPAVAEACAPLLPSRLSVASHPSAASLLESVKALLGGPS